LPAEIAKAHIHVVPSRWDEPFGLTTLEGMASGLATVASATGGTPEVVGDAGLMFDRESVEQLADRLWELVENPDHRREVAARCRRRAEEFTWARTWQRLSGLLAAAQ
jgi:glycosyltransferase involved in cell wall biosynthesis